MWIKTARLALEQDYDVAVSVYDWGKQNPSAIRELENQGAKVQYRSRYSHTMPPLKKIQNYLENRNPRLKRDWHFIDKFKPDHVLINQGGCFDLLQHHYDLYQLLERNSTAYSILSHNHPQYSFLPDLSIYPRGRDVFEKAKHTFFISNKQLQVAEKAVGTQLNNAKITWNPLNLSAYNRIDWLKNDQVQFAMVAGLISGKGHDTAFEIFSQDIWKKRDWQLNIYGSGSGESYLKDLSSFLQIEDRCIFHGYVNDIKEIWRNNHILLIPSAGEGLPISLIEAMICGRPAVVTDVGGNSEVITEGQNGFIAEAPTVSSYANALEKAFIHKEDWQTMGEYANDFCKSNINLEPEKKILNFIIS